MKKVLSFMTALALLITLFISCEDHTSTSSLRIQIEQSSITRGSSRTLSPAEDELKVTSYRFSAEESTSRTTSEKSTYTSVCTLDGLYPGKWIVKAYGVNQAGKDISYGSTETELKEGANNVVIVLNELVGTGSFSLTLKWPKEQIKEPKITLELKDNEGEDVEISSPSISSGEGSVVVTKSNLSSGSYTLNAKLFDKDKAVGGTTEVIRVSNDSTTTGVIDIVYSSSQSIPAAPLSNAEISVSDQTSSPLSGRITGIGKTMSTLAEHTATLVIANESVELSNIDIAWYVDGDKREGESESSLTFSVDTDGQHTVVATFKTDANGSLGNAKVTFTSSSNTNPGSPKEMFVVNEDTGLSIDGDIIAHFIPNGDIALLSNKARTVYIIPKGTTEYSESVQSATFDELEIKGNVVDFAIGGKEEDATFPFFFFHNSPVGIAVSTYTSSGHSLSKQKTYSDIKAKDAVSPISSFGYSDSYYDEGFGYSIIGVAAHTPNNASKGLIFIKGDSPSSDTFTDIVIANEVQGNLLGEGVIHGVQAAKSSKTFTASSTTHSVIYKISEHLSKPAFEVKNIKSLTGKESILKNGNKSILLKSDGGLAGYGFILDGGILKAIQGQNDGAFIQGETILDPIKKDRKVLDIIQNKDSSHLYALTDDYVVFSFTATSDSGSTYKNPNALRESNSSSNSMVLPKGENFNAIDVSDDGKALIAYRRGGEAKCMLYITLN